MLVVVALLAGACGSGGADDPTEQGRSDADELGPDVDLGPDATYPRPTLELVDQLLEDRVASDGLAGAALIVEPAVGERHVHTIGDVGPATEVELAESSFWLVASVVMTLVDDGTIGLDDPIGPHLPWLGDDAAAITARQLLSHTSGLPLTVECEEPTVAACDTAVGGATLTHPPGTTFSVTALDAHVAARLAEAVTGQSWDELFAARLARPTGMEATTFADPTATGGLLAVDASSTPDDLGRFLAVVRDDGRVRSVAVGGEVERGEVEVLTPGALRDMLLDQTVRLDTHDEPWVADTGVPTFGLGVWRDRLRGDDAAATVSAPNRYGLYPLVDTARDTWAIVVVDDRVRPRHDVVAASATLAQITAAALRSTG